MMRLPEKTMFVFFCFQVLSRQQGLSTLHNREKRQIDDSFERKHIVVLKNAGELKHDELKSKIKPFIFQQVNRRKHTVFIAIAEVDGTESTATRKMIAKKLAEVVSQKVNNNQCQEKPYSPYGSSDGGSQIPLQNSKVHQKRGAHSSGSTCQNSKSQKPKYYHCLVNMSDINLNLRMAEFYVQGSGKCSYSELGEFTVGVRVDRKKLTAQSFLVNHLESSQLFNGKKC